MQFAASITFSLSPKLILSWCTTIHCSISISHCLLAERLTLHVASFCWIVAAQQSTDQTRPEQRALTASTASTSQCGWIQFNLAGCRERNFSILKIDNELYFWMHLKLFLFRRWQLTVNGRCQRGRKQTLFTLISSLTPLFLSFSVLLHRGGAWYCLPSHDARHLLILSSSSQHARDAMKTFSGCVTGTLVVLPVTLPFSLLALSLNGEHFRWACGFRCFLSLCLFE